MNYVRIYDDICRSAEKVQKQSECSSQSACVKAAAGKWCPSCLVQHMTIPAGIWGSHNAECITITKAQQVIAYALLRKIYPYSKHIADTYRELKRARGKKRRKIPYRRKPHSAATRAKMSASHTGKTFTPESRQRMSDAKRGRTLSPEHVRNRSESRKRNKRGFSPETIEKMRLAAKNRSINKPTSNTNQWSVTK